MLIGELWTRRAKALNRGKISLITLAYASLGFLLLVAWLIFAAAVLPAVVAIGLDILAVLVFGAGLVALTSIADDTGFSIFDRVRLRLTSTEAWARVSDHLNVLWGLLGGAMAIAIAVLILSESGGSVATAPNSPAQSAERLNGKPDAVSSPSTALPTPPPTQLLTQPVDVQVIRTSNFAWPAAGSIAKLFGADPDGIDINLVPGGDGSVYASSRGIVVFAGTDTCCGNYVEIDHGNGINTRYANLAQALVVTGQHVERGNVVGISGGSRQLHFEVRDHDQKVDPLRYLPSTQFGLQTGKLEDLSCPGKPIALDPNSSMSLVFTADTLSYYSILDVKITAVANPEAPRIVALPRGLLRTSLDVPPPGQATTPIEYLLAATFTRGSERLEVDCRLLLQAAVAVPELPKPAPPEQVSGPSSVDLPDEPAVVLPPAAPKTNPTVTATPAPTKPVASATPFRGTPTKTPAPGTVTSTTPTKVVPGSKTPVKP